VVQNSNVDKKSYEGDPSVRLCNYTDVYYNETIHSDLELMVATATPGEIEKFGLRAGDVIITKDSESWNDIAVPACVAEDMPGVVCGYHLTMFRPRPDVIIGRFLLRALQASGVRDQLQVAATGVTRFGLGLQALKGALLPLPPLSLQQEIVAFLDRKTDAINTVITRKKRSVERLEELRASLISQAVTKGLRPDGPMKDSGVEWVGQIPAHWEMRRLKFLAEVRGGVAKGRTLTGETVRLPYMRVANVQDGYLALDDVSEIEVLQAEVERYTLRNGDILMNEGGDEDKLGRGCVWEGQIDPCLHQNHVFSVRVIDDRITPYWLDVCTSARNIAHYFQTRAKRTTNLASISSSSIKNCPLPIPPREEQRAILEYLRTREADLRGATNAIEHQILRLQEYRQSLITAVVTGQIDVTAPTPHPARPLRHGVA